MRLLPRGYLLDLTYCADLPFRHLHRPHRPADQPVHLLPHHLAADSRRTRLGAGDRLHPDARLRELLDPPDRARRAGAVGLPPGPPLAGPALDHDDLPQPSARRLDARLRRAGDHHDAGRPAARDLAVALHPLGRDPQPVASRRELDLRPAPLAVREPGVARAFITPSRTATSTGTSGPTWRSGTASSAPPTPAPPGRWRWGCPAGMCAIRCWYTAGPRSAAWCATSRASPGWPRPADPPVRAGRRPPSTGRPARA